MSALTAFATAESTFLDVVAGHEERKGALGKGVSS